MRTLYPDDSWTSSLSSARVGLAQKLHAERRARHEDIDLADCLQFCDQRDLVLRLSGSLGHLGFASRHRLERFLIEVEELRDLLAHGQDLVAGSSWPERLTLVQALERVLQDLEARLASPIEAPPPEGRTAK